MQLTGRIARLASVLVAVAAGVAACSSGASSSGGFGGTVSGGTVSGPEPPSSASTTATACPSRQPTAGDGCLAANVCEYGGAADPSCNVIARCARPTASDSDTWTLEQPTHCPTTCPDRFDERVPGAACSGPEVCTYLEATCGCAGAIDGAWTNVTGGPSGTDGGDGDDAGDGGGVDASAADGGTAPAAVGHWTCVRPGNGCPARRPVEGAHCAKDIDCDYGTCVFGVPLTMTCSFGQWVQRSGGSCP